MANLEFTDSSVRPDDKLLLTVIGKNMTYWNKLMLFLHETFKNVQAEWKFYKDAKGWLLPVAVKKKNLCWISVSEGTFRVSFWFGTKVEGKVEDSNLPAPIKEEFRKAKQNKMGRGLSIYVNSPDTLENVMKLIEFKSTLK